MGVQRAQAQQQVADLPDGFGVAVVREDGAWRCVPLKRAALVDLTAAEWDRMHAVNARGPFLMARETARAMIAAGQGGFKVAPHAGFNSGGDAGGHGA